jgi:uncharacterized protein (UPF0332 family)
MWRVFELLADFTIQPKSGIIFLPSCTRGSVQMTDPNLAYQVSLYMTHAREMLQVAQANFEDGFYGSAINRAYYAIFYAASALLLIRGESRSKHSGVIATFRKLFVKTGFIEPEYSDIYGMVMDARLDSDYDMVYEPDEPATQKILVDAQRFVERVQAQLTTEEFNV